MQTVITILVGFLILLVHWQLQIQVFSNKNERNILNSGKVIQPNANGIRCKEKLKKIWIINKELVGKKQGKTKKRKGALQPWSVGKN